MGWPSYIEEYSADCLPAPIKVAKGGESGPGVGVLKVQGGNCPAFPNNRTLKEQLPYF